MEPLLLVAGYLILVVAVAAFDWRLGGVLLGLGVIFSALDIRAIPGGRR
jgi:hypothetical protein